MNAIPFRASDLGPADDRNEAAYDRALAQVERDGEAFQSMYDELTERFGENMAILLTDPTALPGGPFAYTADDIADAIKDAAKKVGEEIARKESEAAQSVVEDWREGAALAREDR